ncbi:YqjF family protein [Hymenobacter tenuis]
MRIPTIHGIIDRRILINFTADPKDVATILPAPFRPKVYKGKAIVGICLIRLKNIKPKGLPNWLGVSSENGAHRIAVEWDEAGKTQEGVFIPRRDTSLRLNALVGGRLFPGKHHVATFNVRETGPNYHVGFVSSDQTHISIDAAEVEHFNSESIFQTLENASDFF